MLRSRSSGLLPITHCSNFPRHDSRNGLSFYVRRRAGGSATAQRALTYVVLAAMLGASVYAVARAGRSSRGGSSMAASSLDEFVLGDALLENARVGAGGGLLGGGTSGGSAGHTVGLPQKQQQQQGKQRAAQRAQQQQQQHAHHMHDDVHDRRAALEQLQQQQHHVESLPGDHQQQQHVLAAQGAELTQEELEQQHLQQLQHLEQEHALAAQQALAEHQQAGAAAVVAAHGHESGDGEAGGAGEHHLHDPVLTEHVAAHIAAQQALPRREGPSLYSANLSAVDIRGNIMHTADLMGKVAVIVNVASRCGFTEANYAGLHRVYERYKGYGLEIIAFPCNQFGHQEPGTHAEIEEFVAQRFGATFPLMSKVEVNGPASHPIFTWLKLNAPPLPGHHSGDAVGWNFEKFLLDKYGHPVKRYGSELDYHELELDIYNELIKF